MKKTVIALAGLALTALPLTACKGTVDGASFNCPNNIQKTGGTCTVVVPPLTTTPKTTSSAPSSSPTPSSSTKKTTTTVPTTSRTTTVPPTSTTSTTPPSGGCANPDTLGEGEGASYGPNDVYYVHNNTWNPSNTAKETMHVCDYNNWWVDASGMNSNDVETYPNVHEDINGGNGTPFSHFSTISGTYAGTAPAGGVYDVAWDLWLNGMGGDAPELMVWTQNGHQTPNGDIVGTFTQNGVTYDVWFAGPASSAYIAFVARTPVPSGSVDLKAIIQYSIDHGYLPQNPTVNQIDYGIEFVNTAGGTQRFTCTDFSLTVK